MNSKLILLDRDGVINNGRQDHVQKPSEFEPIDGSLEAIASLSQAGWRIGIATNQSGIFKGYYDEVGLADIHTHMLKLVTQAGGHIDAIFYCPHYTPDHCGCRKPQPGMLLSAARFFGSDLADVPFVGDTDTDVQAALAAGAQPMLVRTGRYQGDGNNFSPAVPVFDDLAAVASHLLNPIINQQAS